MREMEEKKRIENLSRPHTYLCKEFLSRIVFAFILNKQEVTNAENCRLKKLNFTFKKFILTT